MEDSIQSIKRSAVSLMSYADQDYKHYSSAINFLKDRIKQKQLLAKELEYEQWKMFMDTERHLLGGFFKEWEQGNITNTWYIQKSQRQMEQAFDIIIKNINEEG